MVRRFVRNIHPANVFYLPLTNWRRVGKDKELIAMVASVYRSRYTRIWEEFVGLAGAPTSWETTSEDGPLVIDTASTSTSDPWRTILGVDETPPVGRLLARHPDARTLTEHILLNLTVERLVMMADTLHNKCRPRELEAAAPNDPIRQAELSWRALRTGMTRIHSRPSGWTGAARLLALAAGCEEGLTAVARLDISALASVCARLVATTYREANAQGLR